MNDSTQQKSWHKFSVHGRNHSTGFFKLHGVGEFDYEGWESDWNVLGNTEAENKAMGTYYTCCCENPLMDPYPNGEPHVSIGTGKDREDALDRLKRVIPLELAASKWRKNNPNSRFKEFFETLEYKELTNEDFDEEC